MESYIISWFWFNFDNCFEFLVFVNLSFSFFFNLHFICSYKFILMSIDLII